MRIIKKDFKDLDFLNNWIKKWEVRPPELWRHIFPGTVWRIPVKEKKVFLTFDDGPIPEVTPWVLDCLKKNDAVATFFCVGDNIRKHPDVFQQVRDSGMGIGNHTFSHKRAWKSIKSDYLNDVDRFGNYFSADFFRPPHGQLYPWLVKPLKKKFSKIVMWDILTRDYDQSLVADDIVRNVKDYLRPGSIIVFHDSLKSWPRLQDALPRILKEIHEKGYSTGLLNE